jgi:DNA-binding CsgD family transcriptional regulator/tetratricopeptide (TPR) repeat protein
MKARASEVFVGRTGELGELERVLEAARAGTGETVLVAGEAGIGKTRLAAEVARRARGAGFEVFVGRSIDLVGTELPYLPFAEAFRPLGEPWRAAAQAAGSQLGVFEATLALLTGRAAAAPVLLVLEDLHWADTSTLDLVVFLTHNLHERPVLLLATCRADEPASAARMRRLAEGARRSGSALVLELGPLGRDELTALLAGRAGASLPTAVTDTIVARSEGNPFFAEELLAAAGDGGGELPRGLRDLLLQRVARLGHPAQALLRLAAAAGREVRYPLLRATTELTEGELRDSLRQAVEHGILVAEPETGSFRFRHALLAQAVYATILPGEREGLHAWLAGELARGGMAGAAELAPHWAAAGRPAEAFVASVEAARQAEAVFGLAEAHTHLERVLALWPAVPDAAGLAGIDLAGLCAWTAGLASHVGAAPRAVELARRAIELVGSEDPHRAALLQVDLGEYLYEIGSDDAALAALERAVELVPAEPPSAERAYALGSLAGGVMVAWRHAESLPIGEQALALARELGAGEAEVRALTVLGGDLVYLGRGKEGAAHFRQALQLAEEIGDHLGLARAYTNFTDALTMLGRLSESARLGQAGLKVMRRYGINNTLLVAVTPNAGGWLALAEAEYERARGPARPQSWSQAAAAWQRLERPPLVAYCRWRQAEALVAAGAFRTEAAMPAREAHAVAARIGARPLLRELDLLAQRARLDLAPPPAAFPEEKHGPEEILGLTPREAQVLNLLARGYTNREIAAALVISVKTVSVHVSHILRKLGAPNRLEAAATISRLAPPPSGQSEPKA